MGELCVVVDCFRGSDGECLVVGVAHGVALEVLRWREGGCVARLGVHTAAAGGCKQGPAGRNGSCVCKLASHRSHS